MYVCQRVTDCTSYTCGILLNSKEVIKNKLKERERDRTCQSERIKQTTGHEKKTE
jgi:hypothetical protein